MGETFPEPNDGSPPIPPAIGLREPDEARPGRLFADQLRLNPGPRVVETHAAIESG